METPENILIELSSPLVDFAVKRNYKYIAWKYDTKLFGNIYVVMQGESFDLYVVKDRGFVSVMLGPLSYGESYIQALDKLKANHVADVLEWQRLGNKWYPIELLFEYMGFDLPLNNNPRELTADVVKVLDCNYRKIAGFMREDFQKSGFEDFIAQKRAKGADFES